MTGVPFSGRSWKIEGSSSVDLSKGDGLLSSFEVCSKEDVLLVSKEEVSFLWKRGGSK